MAKLQSQSSARCIKKKIKKRSGASPPSQKLVITCDAKIENWAGISPFGMQQQSSIAAQNKHTVYINKPQSTPKPIFERGKDLARRNKTRNQLSEIQLNCSKENNNTP